MGLIAGKVACGLPKYANRSRSAFPQRDVPGRQSQVRGHKHVGRTQEVDR